MPHFDALKSYSCRKHCAKRRNCLQQAISPFITMFSTSYGTYFSFQVHIKMSSAIYFNSDQSKILSSGNGLRLFLEGELLLGRALLLGEIRYPFSPLFTEHGSFPNLYLLSDYSMHILTVNLKYGCVINLLEFNIPKEGSFQKHC